MAKKEINKIISKRLGDFMYDNHLSYTTIAKHTGYTRQSITDYFSGNTHINLDFTQKYFCFLNDLAPAHNLNFEYFINPQCNIKTKTSDDLLSNLGISQNAINNIVKIISSKNEKYIIDLFDFDDDKKYNYKRLFVLNALLESENLERFLDSAINLYNDTSKQTEIEYLQWRLNNALKDVSLDIAKHLQINNN